VPRIFDGTYKDKDKVCQEYLMVLIRIKIGVPRIFDDTYKDKVCQAYFDGTYKDKMFQKYFDHLKG